jgi:hypothetical protein
VLPPELAVLVFAAQLRELGAALCPVQPQELAETVSPARSPALFPELAGTAPPRELAELVCPARSPVLFREPVGAAPPRELAELVSPARSPALFPEPVGTAPLPESGALVSPAQPPEWVVPAQISCLGHSLFILPKKRLHGSQNKTAQGPFVQPMADFMLIGASSSSDTSACVERIHKERGERQIGGVCPRN